MKLVNRTLAIGILAVAVVGLGTGCETPLGGSGATESGVQPGGALATNNVQGVVTRATGGGRYLLASLYDVQFSFSAVERADGSAAGSFHQSFVADGLLIEFYGEVTCVSVDPVNHRAWIGGRVVANNSQDPAFQTPIHQPGRDVWFRVLDAGEGQTGPDRTTFLGFEGAGGIITSEEYCRVMPWPADNARTHPVTEGNIGVGQ